MIEIPTFRYIFLITSSLRHKSTSKRPQITAQFHINHMKRLRLIIISLSTIILFSNCSQSLVRVQPYDRGNLSRTSMSGELNSLITSMTEHGYFSREASFGGGLIGGGGCGCN